MDELDNDFDDFCERNKEFIENVNSDTARIAYLEEYYNLGGYIDIEEV